MDAVPCHHSISVRGSSSNQARICQFMCGSTEPGLGAALKEDPWGGLQNAGEGLNGTLRGFNSSASRGLTVQSSTPSSHQPSLSPAWLSLVVHSTAPPTRQGCNAHSSRMLLESRWEAAIFPRCRASPVCLRPAPRCQPATRQAR
jgi:hypothetical protein